MPKCIAPKPGPLSYRRNEIEPSAGVRSGHIFRHNCRDIVLREYSTLTSAVALATALIFAATALDLLRGMEGDPSKGSLFDSLLYPDTGSKAITTRSVRHLFSHRISVAAKFCPPRPNPLRSTTMVTAWSFVNQRAFLEL